MLELTEESLAATGPFQSQVLPLLRDAGLGLSIDDFGTGDRPPPGDPFGLLVH
jgi:EAL domain-containing protein (putative c-di-GMP-specific phosphodiesterase class I)